MSLQKFKNTKTKYMEIYSKSVKLIHIKIKINKYLIIINFNTFLKVNMIKKLFKDVSE